LKCIEAGGRTVSHTYKPTVISENENGTDRESAAHGMANFDACPLS